MTLLYIYILIGSLCIPLIYSIFRADVIKYWRSFFLSTILVAIVFLIWDFFFTKAGVWGFNESFNLGIKLFEMPIEEWLFFLIIPFCSLFIHFALYHVFPNILLNKKATIFLTILLLVSSVILILSNLSKVYTAINFSVLSAVLIIGLVYNIKLLQQFYISFLIILIPFIVVNGILTGAVTSNPVVWYNDLENLGLRFYTIPLEDFGYCFSLLFGNLMIFELLKGKSINTI